MLKVGNVCRISTQFFQIEYPYNSLNALAWNLFVSKHKFYFCLVLAMRDWERARELFE